MSTAGTTNIPLLWWTFLIETELMKNVKKAHLLTGLHSAAPDPIGDRIIPSLYTLESDRSLTRLSRSTSTATA